MKWFYAHEGQSLGPVDEWELAYLAAKGKIDGSTLVWQDALPDWRPYAEVAPLPPAAACVSLVVEVALPYAGFWVRLAATIFDILIALLISVVAFPILSLVILPYFMAFADYLFPRSNVGLEVFFQWFPFCVPPLIYTFYETLCVGDGGATPGKMICGVRVVQADGGEVSFMRSFCRCCAKVLNAVTLGLGYLIIALDAQKCGMHDYLCSTRVIHSRPGRIETSLA